MGILTGKRIIFPLFKGEPKGILLRGLPTEYYRSIFTLQGKLNYSTSTVGGF